MLWLDHFITYSGAGPKAPMKILLFDGHSSHTTEDFRLKCWANNIIPYELLSHMTHLMQPCDVGLFQPEKHYHNKAVKAALRGGATSYNVASFLEDWREKVRPLMSSPSQEKWDSFERGTKSVLHNAQLTEFENTAVRAAQLKEQNKGGSSKRM